MCDDNPGNKNESDSNTIWDISEDILTDSEWNDFYSNFDKAEQEIRKDE